MIANMRIVSRGHGSSSGRGAIPARKAVIFPDRQQNGRVGELSIVTAASSNHFRCLTNLLYCIARFERNTRTLVYDLGLTEAKRRRLDAGGWEVHTFPFDDYPPHMNIRDGRGQYAWKPVIVAEVLRKTGGPVLWLDAGNLIQRRLQKIRRVLQAEGFYSPTSPGTIAQWTHPKTLEHLGADPCLLGRPNRNGAIVAFEPARAGIAGFVERWKEGALDESCIAPAGSDRSNHRQDQAVLSVLAYQFQERLGFTLVDECLDITTHNDKVPLAEVRRQMRVPAWVREWLARWKIGRPGR